MTTRRLTLTILISTCALASGFVLSAAPALAARGHVFGSAFGGPGSGAGQLSEPSGIAVDEASGDVYVVDQGNGRVEYFSASGTYLGQFDGSGSNLVVEGKAAASGRLSAPEGIAVDDACELHQPVLTATTTPTCAEFDPSNGDVYVAGVGHAVIDKFSASGEYLGQLSETTGGAGFAAIDGLGVDSKGELWVYHAESFTSDEVTDYSNAVANEFIATRIVSGFGFPEPGFAVDSEDDLYAHIDGLFAETNVIYEFDSTGKKLNEGVDNEPPTAVATELASNDVYIDNVGTVARFTPSGALIERLGSGHLTSGSGVAVSSTAEEVYVADSSADVVYSFPPTPPSAPTVESESLADVTSGSATFNAEIDPRGASTEYHFEYGPTTSYGQSVPAPDVSIGSGFDVHEVSIHLQDLTAHTTYHFRVVAHNELGTTAGVDQAFITQTAGGEATLLDGRSWELVTPPDKHGALLSAIDEGLIQGAADGDAIADLANAPTELEPRGSSNEVTVLSTRGSNGWSSQVIAPPHDERTGASVGNGAEFRLFSEDLSHAIVQPFGNFAPLSPESTESTAYLRTDYLDGDVESHCQSACYQPLVNAGDTPPGTVFGEEPAGECPHFICGPYVVGASPDLSHIVLRSPAQLTQTSSKEGLYEWVAGRLQLISVLPEGETAEGGGTAAIYPALGDANGSARHAISNDGSHVVWEGRADQSGSPHLYLSDTTTGKTIRLDLPQGTPAPGSEPSSAQFQAAGSDGSRIFFLDGERLTEDSTATASEPELYEYDVEAPLGRRLSDLTADAHAGESADVVNVIGASGDGSFVYFTAKGALTNDAVRGECGGNSPRPGDTQTCNLYMWHSGTTTLVATLSAEDFPDWGNSLDHLPARVSPSGRWLAFTSNRDLTGYDTRDAISGRPDEEVYLYDGSAKRLTCASCNPSGARPVGVEYGQGGLLVGADRVWDPTTWLAANVPPWTRLNLTEVRYQSRYLSDSGRLFFDTSDALVPQDVNGTEDVYEYESQGIGSCDSADPSFSEGSGGCIGLISSGTSPEESTFLDASESGGDVFFLTAAKLLPQDYDTSLDVYDAHECTTQAPCFATAPVAPPTCTTGDSCKAAPTPQPTIYGAPSSETFSGAGNIATPPAAVVVKPKSLTRTQKLARALKVCVKQPKRKRVGCKALVRRQFGTGKQTQKSDKRSKKGRK